MQPDEQQFYDELAADLRYARRQRGWTIYDVAAVAGVTATAVSYWERAVRRMKAHHYVALREEGLVR